MTRSPPIRAHLDPGAERERGEQHRHRQLRHLGRRAGDPRGVGLGAAMHDVMHHSNVLQCRGMEEEDISKLLKGGKTLEKAVAIRCVKWQLFAPMILLA